MQSKRRFILRLLALTSMIATGLMFTTTQQTSAWQFPNTRALVLSGFPGGENGALGGQSITDADNNLIMIGATAGTVQVDPANPSLLFGNGNDFVTFLVKYSARGDYVWGVQWPDLWETLDLSDVATTLSGDIYVVGSVVTAGSDIDPSASGTRLVPNANSAVVLKFSASGTLLWVRDFSATTELNTGQIHVTPTGGLLLSGAFEGTLNLDGPGGASGLTFTSSGQTDFFAVSLDSSGIEEWAVTGATVDRDFVGGVEILDSGEIVIATALREEMTLRSSSGSVTTISPLLSGRHNSLLWKLTSTGASVWTSQPTVSSGSDEIPTYLGVRSNSEFLLALNTHHILAVTNTGALSSALQVNAEITDVEVLTSGVIAIAGKFQNTVDLDPTTGVDNRTSTDPSDDAFVTLLTATLSYSSTRVYPSIGPNHITDVSVDNDGGWIVTGWTLVSSPLSLSTTSESATFNAAAGADTMNFIVRYQADGSTAVPIPSAPTSASYAPGNKKATLQWETMSHAARYVVKNVAGAIVCDTTTTSCDVTGLRNGRFGTFTITSYNSAGVASSTATSINAMGGFLVKATSWKVRSKPRLSSIVTTPSKGAKTWRVTSGACRVSGKKIVMPTKKGRCTLTLSVAKKSGYPKMSTTIRITLRK